MRYFNLCFVAFLSSISSTQVGNFIIKDQIDSGAFGVCQFAENI
jgi:hypothetical protein